MIQSYNKTLEDQIVYKKQKSNSIIQIVASLSNEISNALHDEMESVNIFDLEFKKQLNFVLTKILKDLFQKKERTSVYYEAVPGFSLISLRKIKTEPLSEEKNKDGDINSKNDLNNVVSELARKYFDKTNSKIMVIENDYFFMLFFPVSDLESNLKELDFYYIK